MRTLDLAQLQARRHELIPMVAAGTVDASILATVERDLLTAASEEPIPCGTCHGSGWEHITHRIRNRYVDSAVRCTGCDGRKVVSA